METSLFKEKFLKNDLKKNNNRNNKLQRCLTLLELKKLSFILIYIQNVFLPRVQCQLRLALYHD